MKNFIITVIAVALTLGGYEWYKNRESEQYIGVAYISQGLSLASSVRVQVAMHYQQTGKLPSSNAEIDLPPPEQFVSESISQMEITEGGVITIKYNEKSGVKDGLLYLTPDISKPHMGILWTCTTPSFKDIAAWAPQCKYKE